MLELAIVCVVSAVAWLYLVVAHGGFWLTSQRLPPAGEPVASPRENEAPGASRSPLAKVSPALATGPGENGERGAVLDSGTWPTVAAVVPARNEADSLPVTLPALLAQDYPGEFRVFLVDDNSDDGTGAIAAELGEKAAHCGGAALTVVKGQPRPDGWAGKVWAMAQGLAVATRTAGKVLEANEVAGVGSAVEAGGVAEAGLVGEAGAAEAPGVAEAGLVVSATGVAEVGGVIEAGLVVGVIGVAEAGLVVGAAGVAEVGGVAEAGLVGEAGAAEAPGVAEAGLVVGAAGAAKVAGVVEAGRTVDAARATGPVGAARSVGADVAVRAVEVDKANVTAEACAAVGGHTTLAIDTPPEYVLFTDADISWAPTALRDLVQSAEADDRALLSQMALLRTETRWERVIVPAFVYFFAQLYPFRKVSDPKSGTAAAAGGCMLVRRSALEAAGDLEPIRDALIDDVALGTLLKKHGNRTWLGLTTDIRSARPYPSLASLWHMIARSAYVQLRYNPLLLAGTIVGLLVLYVAPPAGVIAALIGWAAGAVGRPGAVTGLAGLVGWALMTASYVPMLRLYRLSALRAPTLPLIAVLYAAMTADSARRHYSGRSVSWRGRTAERV